ncbi:MAG: DUF6311 domain-containing protein [Brevinema sp.]
MDNKGFRINENTREKNITFLSIMLPLSMTLWFTFIVFGVTLNPKSFVELPQNIRNAHITSLFFRADTWHFPITMTKNIGEGLPLSLTNTIPLFALIFKVVNSSLQYFGLWLVISFLLTAFFGYRISYLITSNRILAGLGSLLFVTIPFLWNQTISHFYMAGQWLIIWAYYIFFQKKSQMSYEWYPLLIISCLVHPFFIFITSLIMISDLFHLYVYNHSISVVKAASTFGHFLTMEVLLLSVLGFFYLPFFYDPIQSIPVIYFHNPNLNLGYSLFIYTIISISTALLFFPKTKKYIKYYKPLISSLCLFFFLSLFGNIWAYKRLFSQNNWITEHIFGVFTSGSKFLIPILWLAPIIVMHTISMLEKKKKMLGTAILAVLVFSQINVITPLKDTLNISYETLPDAVSSFLTNKKQLIWIFQDKNIPVTPCFYEQFAYIAYQNNMKINAGDVIRFPSNYRKNIETQKKDFLSQHFEKNSVYIINSNSFPLYFNNLGATMSYKNMILFSPYPSIKTNNGVTQ